MSDKSKVQKSEVHATGGTFTITEYGFTSGPIPFDADEAMVNGVRTELFNKHLNLLALEHEVAEAAISFVIARENTDKAKESKYEIQDVEMIASRQTSRFVVLYGAVEALIKFKEENPLRGYAK